MRSFRRILLLAPLLTCSSACSPGRIAAESETGETADETSSEAGASGLDGDSDADADTDSDSDSDTDTDSDDGGPGWGCKHEGPMAYLDFCEPEDPCDAVACGTCLGGLCVEPAPAEVCVGVAVSPLGISVPEARTSVWIDLDGQPGDELVSARNGPVDAFVGALVDGLEVVSVLDRGVTPDRLAPLRYDDDGILDLLVVDTANLPGNVRVMIGDGEGAFASSPAPLPEVVAHGPVALDFDGDGADDLFAQVSWEDDSAAYRNVGGALELAASFPVRGRLASVGDVDADGLDDDLLLGNYPSPDVLISEDGGLSHAEALPSGGRGPGLEYGLGRPLAADLDADGWIEVVSVIEDNHGRAGLRIWPGTGPGAFAAPRDQLLVDVGWAQGGWTALVGVAELDGVAPPELLLTIDRELVYVRAQPDGVAPLVCVGALVEDVDRPPAIGDLDADGWPELAIQVVDQDLYTTKP